MNSAAAKNYANSSKTLSSILFFERRTTQWPRHNGRPHVALSSQAWFGGSREFLKRLLSQIRTFVFGIINSDEMDEFLISPLGRIFHCAVAVCISLKGYVQEQVFLSSLTCLYLHISSTGAVHLISGSALHNYFLSLQSPNLFNYSCIILVFKMSHSLATGLDLESPAF